MFHFLQKYTCIGATGRMAWSECRQPLAMAPFHIHHNEPGELSQWLCYDDSTINILMLTTTTTTTTIYYYYYYYYTVGPQNQLCIKYNVFLRFACSIDAEYTTVSLPA